MASNQRTEFSEDRKLKMLLNLCSINWILLHIFIQKFVALIQTLENTQIGGRERLNLMRRNELSGYTIQINGLGGLYLGKWSLEALHHFAEFPDRFDVQ